MGSYERAALALADHVRHREQVITQALYARAEQFVAAAKEARAAYEAGQADPEVKAKQDASLITNNGYRMTMELFTQQAEQAQQVADELTKLVEAWQESQ